MNKILWTKDYEKTEIKDLVVKDESVTILFDGSSITFSTYHDQDCCEHVYGDFSIAAHHKERLVGKKLQKIHIKAVENMGFLLCFSSYYDEAEKIFIPCYNHQNGYYSSNLKLTVTEGTTSTEIDVSDLVEDHIN